MEVPDKKKRCNISNIRRYVMSLLYQNGFSSIKIPSSVELSKQFGVARRTARMALERMIEEGYLIGKVGIGTFTNPKFGFKADRTPRLPLIAVGVGDCSHFFFDVRIGFAYTNLMNAVFHKNCNVYPLIHSSSDFGGLYEELQSTHVDGLLFYSPELSQSQINQIQSMGIPVVTVNKGYEDCSSVETDEFSSAKVLLEQKGLLPEEGEILYAHVQNSTAERILKQAIGMRGKSPRLKYQSEDVRALEFENNMRARFASGHIPSLLVIGWLYLWLTQRLFAEFNVDPVNQCKVLVYGEPTDELKFPCVFYGPDNETMSKTAVSELKRLIDERDSSPMSYWVPWKFLPLNL